MLSLCAIFPFALDVVFSLGTMSSGGLFWIPMSSARRLLLVPVVSSSGGAVDELGCGCDWTCSLPTSFPAPAGRGGSLAVGMMSGASLATRLVAELKNLMIFMVVRAWGMPSSWAL